MAKKRRDPLLPANPFVRRQVRYLALALLILVPSLGIGVLGFHYFEGKEWLESFVDASMILSGMGLNTEVEQPAGKVFGAVYALYSGLAFLFVIGIVLAPVIHRLMHQLDLESEEDQTTKKVIKKEEKSPPKQ